MENLLKDLRHVLYSCPLDFEMPVTEAVDTAVSIVLLSTQAKYCVINNVSRIFVQCFEMICAVTVLTCQLSD